MTVILLKRNPVVPGARPGSSHPHHPSSHPFTVIPGEDPESIKIKTTHTRFRLVGRNDRNINKEEAPSFRAQTRNPESKTNKLNQ